MGGRLCMERGFVEKISDIMYTYYVDNINYLGSENGRQTYTSLQ